MSPARRALLQIHLCVVLWGCTAILGKLITLGALSLVWWRMWLVTAILLAVPLGIAASVFASWSLLRSQPLSLMRR